MKDSGKVFLPTPERIEEIKQTADDSWFAADNSRGAEAHLRGEVFALCEGTNELLAALEEAEQQIDEIKLKSHSKIYTQSVQIQTGMERIETLFNELSESRQQVKDLKEDKHKIFAVHDEQCARSSEYYSELIFVKGKLAEAQQTIARHETTLNEIIAYSTDENAVDVASVSMGYVEGEKTDGM
ncbi:hypothetical protein [Paenibacillus sp. FSL L8-0506]|uniref:hypothetical protein n=1 Tax=Paenibacillus sp. FSL L8-0506 TaxID=2975335 RepID=UPI0030FBD72E